MLRLSEDNDCYFPKQSLRSSKEAKGAGPALGCRDLYELSETFLQKYKNIQTFYKKIQVDSCCSEIQTFTISGLILNLNFLQTFL